MPVRHSEFSVWDRRKVGLEGLAQVFKVGEAAARAGGAVDDQQRRLDTGGCGHRQGAATQRRAIGLLEPRSEPRYGADIGANRVSGEIVLARPLLSSTTKDLAKLLKEVQTGLPEEVEIAGVISDGQQPIRKAVKQVLPEVRHQLCQFHYLREAAQPIYEADRHAKKELKKLVRGPTASD